MEILLFSPSYFSDLLSTPYLSVLCHDFCIILLIFVNTLTHVLCGDHISMLEIQVHDMYSCFITNTSSILSSLICSLDTIAWHQLYVNSWGEFMIRRSNDAMAAWWLITINDCFFDKQLACCGVLPFTDSQSLIKNQGRKPYEIWFKEGKFKAQTVPESCCVNGKTFGASSNNLIPGAIQQDQNRKSLQDSCNAKSNIHQDVSRIRESVIMHE